MTIAITGLGLIGGSFAKAAARLGHRVLVENRTRATARLAVEEGVAAGILGEDGCSLAQCEIVIVCLPPELCAPWIENHSHEFAQGTVVCDVAGVKTPVCARLRKFALENRWTFIGAHPMAGREKGGYAQSVADLYCGASMVLTPYPASGRSPLDKLERFCRSIGFAQVVYTTPELHDLMIAYTSQLPHAISYAYSADPLKR
ncbi:MAG: prephenate dehydrogenase, partial [Kiritimatiellae bacterium]|nr:prephenate dehydrogenase [Kiritimatiellia bacterium]